jgi:hypothetical protein
MNWKKTAIISIIGLSTVFGGSLTYDYKQRNIDRVLLNRSAISYYSLGGIRAEGGVLLDINMDGIKELVVFGYDRNKIRSELGAFENEYNMYKSAENVPEYKKIEREQVPNGVLISAETHPFMTFYKFDFNSDGKDEIIIKTCGASACFEDVFYYKNHIWTRIDGFSKPSKIIRTNDFPIIYSGYRGYIANLPPDIDPPIITKYEWNGSNYTKTYTMTDIEYAAGAIRKILYSNEFNDERKRESLDDMKNKIGGVAFLKSYMQAAGKGAEIYEMGSTINDINNYFIYRRPSTSLKKPIILSESGNNTYYKNEDINKRIDDVRDNIIKIIKNAKDRKSVKERLEYLYEKAENPYIVNLASMGVMNDFYPNAKSMLSQLYGTENNFDILVAATNPASLPMKIIGKAAENYMMIKMLEKYEPMFPVGNNKYRALYSGKIFNLISPAEEMARQDFEADTKNRIYSVSGMTLRGYDLTPEERMHNVISEERVQILSRKHRDNIEKKFGGGISQDGRIVRETVRRPDGSTQVKEKYYRSEQEAATAAQKSRDYQMRQEAQQKMNQDIQRFRGDAGRVIDGTRQTIQNFMPRQESRQSPPPSRPSQPPTNIPNPFAPKR